MPRSIDCRQADEKDLLAQALASTASAVFITDRAGVIVWANDAFSRLSGYTRQESMGRKPALLKSGIQGQVFYAELWETILSGKTWQGELVDQRKDGTQFIVNQIITPLFDEHRNITHFIAIQHDITRRAHEYEHDRQLAYRDFLTGLPNRADFFRLHLQAVSHAKHEQYTLATLYLDLDKFKPVNDTLGHQVGDELLVAVAERLRAAVRQEDLVARIGGDEFAILLNHLPDSHVAQQLAQKLVDTLSRPFLVQGNRVSISASIGIAIFPSDGEQADILLEKADKAMYRAKCLGGNNYQFYKAAMRRTEL